LFSFFLVLYFLPFTKIKEKTMPKHDFAFSPSEKGLRNIVKRYISNGL